MIPFPTSAPDKVGFDRKNRPVYPGDEIIDAYGVKYTVCIGGRCSDGPDSPLRDLSDLQGPELILKDGDPRAAIKAPEVPEAVRALHAYDEPSLGRKRPQKEPEKQDQEEGAEAPSAPRKPFGGTGRKNESGLVRVSALKGPDGKTFENATPVLRAAGFEIVKNKFGQPCVRVQDRQEALRCLAASNGAIPPVAINVEPGDSAEVFKDIPGGIEEPGNAEAAVRGILAQFEDEAIVAELRRRGWTVTCTKSI